MLVIAPAAAQQQNPPQVFVPSAQFPTIQSAIDGAPAQAVIVIAPGRYREALVIHGRIVTLVGRDAARRPEIRAPRPRDSVVTFGGGGGAELRNLVLHGGDHGLLAVDPQGLASVAARNVAIRDSGTGVAGAYAALSFVNGEVRGNRRHGFALTGVRALELSGLEVADNGCLGILIVNTTPAAAPLMLAKLEVHDNACGGIEIRGGATPVRMRAVFAKANAIFGINLAGASDTAIADSVVSFTKSDPVSGEWGDGLRILSATAVDVAGSLFSFSARAGALVLGCADGRGSTATFTDDNFFKNSFAIDVERRAGCAVSASGVALTDGGGNVCDGDPDCHAVSSGLDPIDPAVSPAK
jgi:hypothetical protein